MSHVIAMVGRAEGCGKTTTLVNLASALARGAIRRWVLVIDLDVRGDATSWLGCSKGGLPLAEAIAGRCDLREIVEEPAQRGISLICGGVWLAEAEDRIREPGQGHLRELLQEMLDVLPFDLVLVDCPSNLGPLTKEALVAADTALAPVNLKDPAPQDLADLTRLIDQTRSESNPDLRQLLLAHGTFQNEETEPPVAGYLRRQFGDQVLRTMVPASPILGRAARHQQPIHEFRPRSPAAKAYRQAAQELLGRMDIAFD